MNEIKRIGIDVRLWSQTGIGRYIRNLVLNLLSLDKRSEYILFISAQDALLIKSVLGKNLNFQLIEANIPWHTVQEQINFPQTLNKYKLDLVHFPYFSVPILYNKPFVVTVHDLIIDYFPTGRASTLPLPLYYLKRVGYSIILKRTLKKAKKIITPTIATKKEIEKLYKIFPSKIVVTPEGVDNNISDFNPVIFNKKNPYFLYVGNAYPHKNLEVLVEAFEVFRGKHPVFNLKLVGKEDFFYKRLKRKVEERKIKNIEFLGYVSDDLLGSLYKNSTATVIPSLMEGFGLTALEAMKMGSIVIASDIPSLKEVCKNNAFYFDPLDSLSLVGMFEKMITFDKSILKRNIEKAKKHANLFSWDKTAKKTLDVYYSCL